MHEHLRPDQDLRIADLRRAVGFQDPFPNQPYMARNVMCLELFRLGLI